ncbi:MAG: chemotaxis protein CheW [Desulfobacterales bacterium]|nr:chemotaxis protein CheW [Desulfobacterales bacterium]
MSIPSEPTVTSPPLEALLAEIESDRAQEVSTLTQGAASSSEEEEASLSTTACIRFSVDKAVLAAPLSAVIEVARMPRVTPLPGLPAWLEGITNIRGEVVSVVDMSDFFGWGARRSQGDSLMVFRDETMKVGFRVGRLQGMVSLNTETLQMPSGRFSQGDISEYVQGGTLVDEAFLYLLSVNDLLGSKRLNAFRRTKGLSL